MNEGKWWNETQSCPSWRKKGKEKEICAVLLWCEISDAMLKKRSSIHSSDFQSTFLPLCKIFDTMKNNPHMMDRGIKYFSAVFFRKNSRTHLINIFASFKFNDSYVTILKNTFASRISGIFLKFYKSIILCYLTESKENPLVTISIISAFYHFQKFK